jgi:hypothetical protein
MKMMLQQILMKEHLLTEMADVLERALEYIDAEGPYDDEENDAVREDVMQRIVDVLHSYSDKEYEVVDGEVVWPSDGGPAEVPVTGAEGSSNA